MHTRKDHDKIVKSSCVTHYSYLVTPNKLYLNEIL